MKKFDWIVIGLIIVLVLASQIYTALSPADSLMSIFTIDDAYYYFKTAQNISLGYGVTFDRINPGNGFHPLWMLICVTVYAIFNHDLITPLRAIAIIMGLLHAGTGILLYFLLKRAVSQWVAGLGALFWVLTPAIRITTSMYGLETGLSIFSIVLFLFLVAQSRENSTVNTHKWIKIVGLGFSASLVVLSRLDNIFIVAVVGLWFVLRELKVTSFYITDIFLSALSVIISFIIRVGLHSDYGQFLQAIFSMLWVVIFIRPLVFALMNVSHRLGGSSWVKIFLRSLIGSAISTAFIGIIMLTLSYTKIIPSLPRSTLLFDAILSSLLLIGFRMLWIVAIRNKDVAEVSNLSSWVKTNWKRFFLEGVAFMGPVAILLIGYMLWNYSLVGTFLPLSGQIKHWWGTLPNTVYAHQIPFTTLLGLSPSRNIGPLALLTGQLSKLVELMKHWFNISHESITNLLLLVSMILVVMISWLLTRIDPERFRVSSRKTALLPLALGCFLQFSYYQGTNYLNTRFWYWIADSLFIIIIFTILADLLFTRLIRLRIHTWVLQVGITLLAIILIFGYVDHVGFILSYHPNPDRHDWYLTDARGLEHETESGGIVGMTGGGTVGYFVQNRTIINLDGLMNSLLYFRAMQNDEVTPILTQENMRYILSNENMITASDPYQNLFKGQLQKIGYIKGEEGFTLFRYLPTP